MEKFFFFFDLYFVYVYVYDYYGLFNIKWNKLILFLEFVLNFKCI